MRLIWNSKDRKLGFMFMVATVLSSLVLTPNFVDCDGSNVTGTTLENESGQGARTIYKENENKTLSRSEQLLQALNGKANELNVTAFDKQNTWDKKNVTCTPTKVIADDNWDECLKASVSINAKGELTSFLGYVLSCNPIPPDNITGSCGCMPDTDTATDFTVDNVRAACLMKDLKEGDECISPRECQGDRHCVYDDSKNMSMCKSSSSSFTPTLILVSLITMISIKSFVQASL